LCFAECSFELIGQQSASADVIDCRLDCIHDGSFRFLAWDVGILPPE
jgi:hypothetical protein